MIKIELNKPQNFLEKSLRIAKESNSKDVCFLPTELSIDKFYESTKLSKEPVFIISIL